MKSQLPLDLRMWVLTCVTLFAVLGSTRAFPPAPDHVIYGMIRDELGNPATVTNATVILETSAGVRITTKIVPFLASGMNYRLTVPMDSGLTADAYKPTALQPTVPFRVKVQIGLVTYLPIQMKGDYAHLGQPAEQTRLDLFLGEDSIGDGIPDAWKRMVLSMSGGAYTNISQIHPGDRYPGNGMTFMQAYIAGTYPWDLSEGFALTVVGLPAGVPVMEFLAIQGRTYSIHGSADLAQWTAVSFQVGADDPQAPLLEAYQAKDVRKLQIVVPAPGGTTNRFFKAMVQ
jgi:hypothetical protein